MIRQENTPFFRLHEGKAGAVGVADRAGVQELDAAEGAVEGNVGVAEKAERRAGAERARGEAIDRQLHAVAVAVGGENADAAEIKKRAVGIVPVPVAVAADDRERQGGESMPERLGVRRHVAEEHGGVR